MSGYTIEQPSACHAGTIVTQIDRDVERGPRVRANLGDVFLNLKGCGRTVTLHVLYQASTSAGQ